MSKQISFDQLPNAVTMLTKEVSDIKRLLIDQQQNKHEPEQDKLLTIEEASKLLHLSKPTLYSKVSRKEVPFMKKSKRLYFSKHELLEYVKEGRSKTDDEIRQEAETYLSNNKKALK